MSKKILISVSVTLGTLVASLTLAAISTLVLVGIFVNIIDKDRILPNIYLEDANIGLMDVGDVRVQYETEALSNLPSTIKLTIGKETKEYSTKDLSPELYLEDIQNVGRDSNFVKVMEEIVSVTNRLEFSYEYKFNVNKIISEFKLFNDGEFKFLEDDGRVVGCSKDGLSAKLVDIQKVSKEISDNIVQDKEVKIEKSEILSEGTAQDVFLICNRYKYDSNAITAKFQRFGEIKNEEVLSFMGMYLSEEGDLSWGIYNKDNLKKFLTALKQKTEVALNEGQYEEVGGKIRLFAPYKEGRSLDIDSSMSNIVRWSADPVNKDVKMVFKATAPWYILEGKVVEDFSYELSRGESRLNYNIENGKVGVQEIDNYLLNPGQEYSFYNMLSPSLQDIWRTPSGRAIEMGICSSSTTIFRAAIEAGFPITERYAHGWSLPKYEWPYEQNVVDATYLTNPKIDLKFVNDLAYPVIFKSEMWEADGWQYLRVKVMTSPKAKNREVVLNNFRKWDERLPGIYKGSFDRTVTDKGVVTRQETFTSDYYMYAPY